MNSTDQKHNLQDCVDAGKAEETRQFIETGPGVTQSRAGISHGVAVGPTLYIGGQLSVAEDGQYISGTAKEEADRAFQNLFAVVAAAGFENREIAFLELAFGDLADLPAVSAVYNRLFPEHRRPCRTVHEVAKLPYNARIRISGVAISSNASDVIG